ncbi:hypothetical protein K5I29_08765 [Flavobacterium agricola]|uniref:Uncharacterized protein n=1 Tax=Flavobacterium agricola TaxID=2870839 RepID=A0ABY6LWP8_9FLAO|nr:hypothetical protein [Flavobacterium agricola]UYW00629.1 hypothetical protein K5I29_08765 [Flavobacterium agricola]
MNFIEILKQKSPLQRFLFVLNLIFLILYVFMAVVLFVWKTMPVEIPYKSRVILGVILIIYAIIRFYRLSLKFKQIE